MHQRVLGLSCSESLQHLSWSRLPGLAVGSSDSWGASLPSRDDFGDCQKGSAGGHPSHPPFPSPTSRWETRQSTQRNIVLLHTNKPVRNSVAQREMDPDVQNLFCPHTPIGSESHNPSSFQSRGYMTTQSQWNCTWYKFTWEHQ